MRKILFLFNVDWNWIKQRPHFMAEGISDYLEVTVLYQYRYNRTGYQHRIADKRHTVKIIPFYTLPKLDRILALRPINDFIRKVIVKKTISQMRPDYICITNPMQIEWLPETLSCKLIYDCMDAHVLFSNNLKFRNRMQYDERDTCDRCQKIICSSDYLKEYIINEYNCKPNKISVIRNAYNGEILVRQKDNHIASDRPSITYFGTISSWFDFALLEESLNDVRVCYKLYGPIAADVSVVEDDNIQFCGTVEHSQLANISAKSDALIMPFIVDKKIKAVDPVKMYEYINFNKCIISVWYPELERFRPYVYFYHDRKEYVALIKKLINEGFPTKYTNDERIEFLQNNNWKSRCKVFEKILNEID